MHEQPIQYIHEGLIGMVKSVSDLLLQDLGFEFPHRHLSGYKCIPMIAEFDEDFSFELGVYKKQEQEHEISR